jgi:hypothetical protein
MRRLLTRGIPPIAALLFFTGVMGTLLFWRGAIAAVAVGLVIAGASSLRLLNREVREEQARRQFRPQRERLEAKFLTALGRIDPVEKLRWEDATWNDEIVWARDRRTRRLLALIGVRFAGDPLFDDPELPPRHATALFELRGKQWMAEGKRLDEVRPDEALLRHQRFVPVVLPQQRG